VRRLAHQKRVGHAGTLDPAATGVLPVLLGRATRLVELIQAGPKTYRATVRLGQQTATDDAEGDVIAAAAVPALDERHVEAALARFRGEIQQLPPRYSAIRVGGQHAYALARRGAEVALAPRRVTIHDLRLLDLRPDLLHLEVTCSSGTYIRALGRDIAIALGTLGHVASLERTRVGPFALAEAVTLDALAEGGIAAALRPPSEALPEAPRLDAPAAIAAQLANGRAVSADGLSPRLVWVYDPAGRLVCLAASDGTLLRTRILL
jgi:tRNA pseudouridine55 synthase